MIITMNFGIPINIFIFNIGHKNDAYLYVLCLFELPAPQENTVMYVFK